MTNDDSFINQKLCHLLEVRERERETQTPKSINWETKAADCYVKEGDIILILFLSGLKKFDPP